MIGAAIEGALSLPWPAKRVILAGVDVALVVIALWISLSLRYGEIFLRFDQYPLIFSALSVFSVLIFVEVGIYRPVTRYVGEQAILQIGKGALCSTALLLALMLATTGPALPRSTFLIYGLVIFGLLVGSRWCIRSVSGAGRENIKGSRVAIYGAGASGRQLANMLRAGPEFRPMFFFDDRVDLQGREIHGLRVYPFDDSARARLAKQRVDEVFMAMPSASRQRHAELIARLERLPVRIRTVPHLHALVSGEARLDQVQEIRVEDLLGRDPVQAKPELLSRCITEATVLVTGAGGSIGAELCRQILALAPARLVLLEQSECGLYTINRLLSEQARAGGAECEIVPVLGSVTDESRVQAVLERQRVDTVYHAAAYKHVPLVQTNPFDGVRNNAIGTWVMARAAVQAGVSHFVLISTDKAVRPTNVMGASKRLAELVCQGLARRCDSTRFSIVRFGNVLGSSGSVVPLFRQQIAAGGPMTVTHPDVTRYFMTIAEAVELVIQAGAMARGGDVFVLDMGNPVKILELAYRMVRLAGLSVRDSAHPNGDIEIAFSGLRPGEKLYEELLIGNSTRASAHPRIAFADEAAIEPGDLEWLLAQLDRLIATQDRPGLDRLFTKWVDGYRAEAPAESKADLPGPQTPRAIATASP